MSGKSKKTHQHKYNTRENVPVVDNEDFSDAAKSAAVDDAMPLGKQGGGAAAASQPSTADLMKAITTLQGSITSVESKLTNLSNQMTTMQVTLTTVTDKVRDIEDAVTRHDGEIQAQGTTCKSLQAKYDDLHKKLLQMETISRRLNIRITSISEAEAKTNTAEFVANLIPQLLGPENFPDGVLVDIAHRVGPAQDGRDRAIIAKIHYLHEKNLITKLASQKAPLDYNGGRVSIFPDIPTEIFQQRKKFYAVRGRCRTAGLLSGFVGTRQTRLRITRGGTTRYFDTPQAAGRFLDRIAAAVTEGNDEDNGSEAGEHTEADSVESAAVNGGAPGGDEEENDG